METPHNPKSRSATKKSIISRLFGIGNTPAKPTTPIPIIESTGQNPASYTLPLNLKKEKGVGKWSRKYKKSINCKHPKGFSQKQYCKYGRNTKKSRK